MITAEWTALVGAVGLLLFGGGGLVAWLRHRSDNRRGVTQERRADVDSLNAHSIAIIENQVKYLVDPLKSEIDQLRKAQAEQKAELKKHQDESKRYRERYYLAISVIQDLYDWITEHMPLTANGNRLEPPPNPLTAWASEDDL